MYASFLGISKACIWTFSISLTKAGFSTASYTVREFFLRYGLSKRAVASSYESLWG
jgi:hypothetical protein